MCVHARMRGAHARAEPSVSNTHTMLRRRCRPRNNQDMGRSGKNKNTDTQAHHVTKGSGHMTLRKGQSNDKSEEKGLVFKN